MRHATPVLIALLAAGCGGPPAQFAGVKAAADKAPAPGAGNPADAVPRKIAYKGSVDLTVADAGAVKPEVERVTAAAGGYVAKEEETSAAGARRVSTWTVRVPADKFRAAVDGFRALGTVTRTSSDAQDVTDEFIDVDARLSNLKKQEDALNRLMGQAKTVADTLAAQEQVTRVRTDIDRTEGRLKSLNQSVTLATVTVTAREPDPYSPPAAEAAPTFAGRASGTLARSWDGLLSAATTFALFLVALVPWVPLLLVLGLLARWGVKRTLRWAGRQVRWLASPARPAPPADPFAAVFQPPPITPPEVRP